ncbi:hypothetical protein JVT61DRAFT_7454 [Boletus reticuloceps]|uniref:Fungal-type protein kinase domain-containing protein n=1 Tax=Boletus reticuloceps TaxID=495285 RepID=A0A8I2YIU7_9AGAM|nr:hypothetical protein JVT61DRAFT_7454 [Boletus reticuloceps]
MGEDVVFTFFDRGGSISTSPISMHKSPKLFLHILLRITFAPCMTLSFDPTVHEVKNRTRDIEVTLLGGTETINVNELLFISGSLHGQGTIIWSGQLTWLGVEQEVVVKDCFIDPLRPYTEGNILAMLNDAKVAGVPQLIHEQLVQTEQPIMKDAITNSTHILCTLLGAPQTIPCTNYASSPAWLQCPEATLSSNSLPSQSSWLVFLDCITSHCGALELAKIIHHDISLFNLLFAPGTDRNLLEDMLQSLPLHQTQSEYDENLRETLHGLIDRWSPRCGLLADWGYATPTPDHPDFSLSDDSLSPACLIDSVLVKRSDNRTVFVPLDELDTTDDIVLPMADDKLSKAVCNAKEKLH